MGENIGQADLQVRQPYNHRQDICSQPVYIWWGISDPAAGGGGVSAQRYGGQNMQLEYRVYLVGDFKKPRHRKGSRGDREKLVYR